ncbi:hypothetical protein BT69DRAFT_1208601, partial [Atractiella rhizophila]
SKLKWHILVHLVPNIKKFGPCLGFNTEKYEKFNGIFRNLAIFSNRLATSRDVGRSFEVQEVTRHIISEGF